MSVSDYRSFPDCNPRGFLKTAGIGAAALAIPGMVFVENSGAASMSRVRQDEIETDVLVIAGVWQELLRPQRPKRKDWMSPLCARARSEVQV